MPEYAKTATPDVRDMTQSDGALSMILYKAYVAFVESWRDQLFAIHGEGWAAHYDRAAEAAVADAFTKKLKTKLTALRKVPDGQ